MLKIAFCDDQQEILDELCMLMEQYKTEQDQKIQFTSYRSPTELLAKIEHGVSFDAIFLDVLMKSENGIEVAKEIRNHDKKVIIMFLTSTPEYAVESYSVDAAFYQLKPITKTDFYKLMSRIIEEQKKNQTNYLIIKSKEGITKINPTQLVCCETINRSMYFRMSNGTVSESTDQMEDIEKRLSGYKEFIRPHRSYLINMDYIQTISAKSIVLNNLMDVPIPHGKLTQIKNAYLEYLFSTCVSL